MNMKKENGITLIALIITIVIMLILAGVTLKLVIGENGLFAKAKYGGMEYEIAQIKDSINTDIIDKCANEYGNITKAELKAILEKYGTIFYKDEDEKDIDGIITKEKKYKILLSDIWNGKTNEVLKDGTWNEKKQVNSPKLMTGMTGVFWDENGIEQEVNVINQDQWYDYSNIENSSKWANAKTKDGSYWVWIPRFAYSVTSQYHTGGNTAGNIDVEFLKNTSNESSTGRTTYDNKSGINKWNIHPAFTNGSSNNFENGEWDKEIPGFWVAKYQAGYQANTLNANTGKLSNQNDEVKYSDKEYTAFCDSITSGIFKDNAVKQNFEDNNFAGKKISYPVFKPLTCGYNLLTIGDAYTITQEIDGKDESGINSSKATDFYGLSSDETDSHMLKNSEWGAVAYLTNSIYGRHGKEVTMNTKNIADSAPIRDDGLTNADIQVYGVTGYSGDSKPLAGNASSTGNIFGVYDLNGCFSERVAGYDNNAQTELKEYGKSLVTSDGTNYRTGCTKYITLYPYNPGIWIKLDNFYSNYSKYSDEYEAKRYGEAILETSENVGGSSGSGDDALRSQSWNRDFSIMPYDHYPFFVRNGHYYNVDSDGITGSAGEFAFSETNGSAYYNDSFRAVLIGIQEN